jgi:hypothetical protein
MSGRFLWALLVALASCKRPEPAPAAGACDSAAACMALVEARLRAPSPGSDAVVIAALGRACDLRSGEACLRLSHFLVLRGAEREPVNSLLDRACEAGHQGACVTVAEALVEGSRGRARDLARGRTLLQRACQAGETEACGRLAELPRAPDDAGAARQATSPGREHSRPRAVQGE